MSVTFGEMVDFVRLQADADEIDAPDAVLQTHARVAYRNILDRRNSWDHLTVEYTLESVAGTSEYAFTGLAGGDDLQRVWSVSCSDRGNGYALEFLPREDAEARFGSNPNETEFALVYTVQNGRIRLWPTPNTAHTYKVRGTRKPSAWPAGAGSTPDLPDRFHDAIQWFMLSGYFMSQEDPQLAGVYAAEFEQVVKAGLKGSSSIASTPRVMVLGGSERRGFRDLNPYLDIEG